MSLDPLNVKEELAILRTKRATLDRKIQGLEYYLGQKASANRAAISSGISARGGIDIRPDVQVIFTENSNDPIKLKDLVDMVAQRHSDTDRSIIEKKMAHVKRTILKKAGYGMYHLEKENTP